MRNSFLVFGAPCIDDNDIQAVSDVLESKWIGQGPKVQEFEKAFADYKQSPHAIAVNSCTAALQLALKVAGVEPGDEVITTALTFCATANAIVNVGARPVLADIDSRTHNLNPDDVLSRITSRTRAIVPVHFAGRACDMTSLMEIAKEHDLKIVEDCAHAIEATWQGQQAGTIGDFGCFSFYATKNMTCGEGGMILCEDEADAARMRKLALHGMSRDAWKRMADPKYIKYAVDEIGFKFNMTDISAALGVSQLVKLETRWTRRNEIWQTYMRAFADLPVELPANDEEGCRHARHLFTVLVDASACGITRAEMISAMAKKNIGVGVHYAALPEHPAYQDLFGWHPDDTPIATKIGRTTVSLPLAAWMTDNDVSDVVNAVRSILPSRAQRTPIGGENLL